MKRLVAGGIALLSVAPIVAAWRRGSAARHLERWQHVPTPARWPSVSIIIPAWNEQGTLVDCLNWLKQVEYSGEREIIVVAGGPDGTLEAAQAYAAGDPRSIQVLPQRSDAGKNGAMNDGVGRAKGEILIFLDADTIVTAHWVSAMVKPLEDGYAACTGKFVPTRRTRISRALEMSQVLEYEARGRVQLQGSGGMAVRREVFESLGGIPEGGPYADDWDLSQRLVAAGYKLGFAPAALSCSERPSTLGEWWRNEVRWRRIHLISLFRVAGVELSEPGKAARALYPYATAWGALVASAVALGATATRWRGRSLVQALWLAFVAPILAREVAGAAETAAYTGDSGWLRLAVLQPLLTVLGWTAAAFATLTTYKAQVHYKGPRRQTGSRSGGGASQGETIEDVLIGAVG